MEENGITVFFLSLIELRRLWLLYGFPDHSEMTVSKAEWTLGIILELFIIGVILLSTKFLSTFEKNGRTLIGLYDEGFSGDLLGLGITIKIENFH
jgi:hypothetical protein